MAKDRRDKHRLTLNLDDQELRTLQDAAKLRSMRPGVLARQILRQGLGLPSVFDVSSTQGDVGRGQG